MGSDPREQDPRVLRSAVRTRRTPYAVVHDLIAERIGQQPTG